VATIYLSSTYRDLEAHRQAVYRQLTQMQHKVIAMEDYVARDERPADACTRDVANCDLYVGVLAWRYGYVPDSHNPENLSITELEYRTAQARGIPRLVFLLDEAAAWPPPMTDSHTGDNDSGKRIRTFRGRLAADRVVDFFTSAENLAGKVGAAVHVAGTVAQASDASYDLAQIVGQDVIDRPEMLFSQSYVPYLVNQIAQLGDAPLLKIDLKDGNYWWSTRLYGVATLALEYTSVEWLLFLDAGEEYVGMVRPADLRRALARAQPALEEDYRRAAVPPAQPGIDPGMRAGEVLQALVDQFKARPGGEEQLRFLVDSKWISRNVPGLSRERVERAGPFDPLATSQLLGAATPYVPITEGKRLLKVIDRAGVAVEIARVAVERQLGRATPPPARQ
jgi:hypothetical protein